MLILSVNFQSNIMDRFNEDMSCITQFAFLHFILRKLQMLLIFIRHQMMFNVSNFVLCAELT